MHSSSPGSLLARQRRVLLLLLLFVLPVNAFNMFDPFPRVSAAQVTLQMTVRSSLGGNLPGVSVSVYYTGNGSLATTGITDSTGNSNFTLNTGNEYTVIASAIGYDDGYVTVTLGGSTQRTITLDPVFYSGSVLAGAYATQPRYNPGDSGKLAVWIYNRNATFVITITMAEVRLPWFSDYGNSYIGNTSLPGLPHQIQPLSGLNLTASFSIPNDSRAGALGGLLTSGHVYFEGTAPAWKIKLTMMPGAPESSLILATANFDGHTCTEFGCYSSQGFAPSFGVPVSIATYDNSGTPSIVLSLEILIGLLVLDVAIAAITLTRLRSRVK